MLYPFAAQVLRLSNGVITGADNGHLGLYLCGGVGRIDGHELVLCCSYDTPGKMCFKIGLWNVCHIVSCCIAFTHYPMPAPGVLSILSSMMTV